MISEQSGYYMKVKVLVVEDEVIVAEELVQLLTIEGYDIIGRATSASQALQLCRQNPPDIALLDINIDGDRNGLTLAAELSRQYEMSFIFLTAYDDQKYIKQAAELSAHSFIIKPFQSKSLLASVRMAAESVIMEKQGSDTEEQILNDRIFIKSGDRFQKVMIDDVTYGEAVGSYTKLSINGDDMTIAMNLKKFMDKITSPLFVRVHRSYVVNIAKVDSINGNTIYMGEHQIPMSSSYREHLLNKISLL